MKNTRSQSMITDLTSGSVTRQLLLFAMPLFVANALQAVYNLVDMVVVGQVIGGPGMSAVSIGGDVLHLLTFLAMGFSSAGQVIIAQFVGAKKSEPVRRLIGTMFTFLLGISILISLLCTFIRHPILDWLNTPAESYAFTMDYMMTCVVGLPFIYGYNIVSAILRGMGDSRRPFIFIAIAAVLNMVLDILFVGFLGLEVFGAALATVIGQGVSFIISLIYLYRNRESFGFDFRLSSFRIDTDILRPLLSLGIPMAIQSAAINISKIVLMAWINQEGVIYSALSGIYNKTGMMIGIVSNSFTTAGSSMVGQTLGAKRYDRVPRILGVVLGIGLGISTVASILLLAFPQAICEIFTNDAAVLAESSLIIVPMVLNFYGAATRSGAFSIINGSGNSRLNLLVAIIDGVIGRVGMAALLGFAFSMGSQGFWYGDALAGFMPFIIGGSFYLSGRWKIRS
ncbi:MAG: MATE family efflux transporter [Blautia sp.]|nr:MATE family efflux transporter [Blautia sp.]